MRYRFCDYCGKIIDGDFYKICRSHYAKIGGQRLTHFSDMCLPCEKRLSKHKSRWPHEPG